MKHFTHSLTHSLAVLLLFIMFSCQKEADRPVRDEGRSMTQSRVIEDIQITDIVVDVCCLTARVYTNVTPTYEAPIHAIAVIDDNGTVVTTVRHGGQYGSQWIYDPNSKTDFKYYWIMHTCAVCSPGEVCLEAIIVGRPGDVTGGSSGAGSTGGLSLPCVPLPDCRQCDTCTYYLCWEEFAILIEKAQGIVVEDPNGNIIELKFEDDGIDLTENYDELKAAIKEKLGPLFPPYTGTLESYRPDITDCYKAGNPNFPVPGLFFTLGNYKILSIYGTDENGDAISVSFRKHNCP